MASASSRVANQRTPGGGTTLSPSMNRDGSRIMANWWVTGCSKRACFMGEKGTAQLTGLSKLDRRSGQGNSVCLQPDRQLRTGGVSDRYGLSNAGR